MYLYLRFHQQVGIFFPKYCLHIISLHPRATLLIILPGITSMVWCFKDKKEIKMMYNGASGVQVASGIQESHKSDLLSSVVLISCQVTIRFDQ